MLLSNPFAVGLGLLSLLRSAGTYTNPIRPSKGADPQVTYTGGYYYLISTGEDDLQLSSSTTIEGLKTATPKLIQPNRRDLLPSSRCCNIWAPEIHYFDGRWYLYYTAGHQSDLDGQRMHVLRGGATPWDEWSYIAEMTDDWGIDGTVLRFDDWGNYFLYSCRSGVRHQSTCMRKLGDDYISTGNLTIISEPDQPWEKSGSPIQEGFAGLYFGGKTYIAYSVNHCRTPDYCVATLEWDDFGDPAQAGSWKKSDGCVLKGANGHYGAGHNSFFQSANGTIYITFHATANPKGGCDNNRYSLVQPLTANPDGSPNFGVVEASTHEWPEPE